MPRGKLRPTLEEVKALLAEDQDFLPPLVQAVLQELLEAEMTEVLGAEKGEGGRRRGAGHRSGYYGRTLVTGSASWSSACRRIGRAASRPSCSSATSVRRRRLCSSRCTCRGLDPQGQGDHGGALRPQL